MLSRSNRFLLTVWVCFLILMTIVNFSHASEIYHNGSTSAPDLGSAVVQPDYTLRRVFVVGDATAYTYATLNSIGVSIKATSTYYANNRAEVYYRETGDSTWIAAHELSISPYDRTYYAAEYWWYGSIVNLTTDTEYDIRVVIIPSGGGSSIVDTYSTVKTRHEPGRGTILQTLYVSKSGSDSNSGTESAPFLTIQHAVDQASAGTKIKVAAGAYRENITISRNGTSANPIVLEGGDGVILDGHTVLSGTWTLDADDLYYIGSVTEYPSSIDVGTAVQTENRTRVYEYCSSEYAPSNFDLDDLRNRAAEVADLSVSWAPHYTVYGGWYYDDVNDRVYLRVPDDSNINNLSVWAGDDGTAIVINGNFIIVQGFDIRYYKKAITSSHQRFCIIRDNDIYRCQSGIEFLLLNSINGEDLTGLPDWSTLGTAGYSDGHYAGCLNEGTIVEYNTVTDPDTYAWGYGRGKTKPTIETTSIQVSGPGTIVRYNYTQGFFKGISASWDVSNANRDLARDVDMYNNIVCESISDSFEPEGNLINVRIWGNRCRDMWTGVSIAPVRYGPMYVWKNIFIDHGLTAFKLSSSTTGYTYIYNNTVKTDVPGIPGWRNSGYWSNVIWKNNIVISQWLLMEEDVGSADNGLELDYNLYYTPYNPGGNILQLRRKSFASIGALYNWFANDPNAYFTKELEKNSLFGNVQFVSTWPNDDFPISDMYKPVAGSLSVDSGTIIPNFSIGFEGSAPDIGTVESGALTITNSTQFLAVINSSFNQNLTATGGLFPYSWAIVSGNLSPGLNLDSATGEIYGIPTVGGQCNFVVEVQDSNLNSYNKEFSILVVSYGEEFLAEGGGCFIATAAFGTKMAKEVRILCKFRDKYLLTNFTGKIFVAFYYKYSPFIATYIAKRNSIKGNIRVLLNPLINLSEFLCEK